MVTAGVVGQPPIMLPSNSRPRLGDYNPRPASDNQALPLGSRFGSGSTKALMDSSIWGTGSFGSGLGSMSRDRSRNRENGSLLASEEQIDGKTGSSALISNSDTDPWNQPQARSRWNSSALPTAHSRSSEVSPVRQRSFGNALALPGTLSGLDVSSPGNNPFSPPRHSVPNNSTTYRPLAKPVGENGNGGFYHRSSEGFANAKSNLSRGLIADIDGPTSIDTKPTHWADSSSLHSPVDDRRRSVATNSDYFAHSSATASRSGSLPPSRHGSEPTQFSQNGDAFARFAPVSQPSRNNVPSLSQYGPRGYQDSRSDSIHSENALFIDRLALTDHEPQVSLHKSSLSRSGFSNPFSNNAHENGLYQRAPPSEDSYTYETQSLTNGSGSYTPNGYPTGAPAERYSAYRDTRTDRGSITPYTGSVRQSPHYSLGGTPPAFDHLYPSRGETSARPLMNNNPALLESKLRALQQQTQAQNYMDPSLPSHFHMLAQLRGAYGPYAYSMHNPMHMNGLNQGLPMQMPMVAMPGMMVEAPKGPRQEPEGTSVMSALLNEFKSNNKNRRWELKDIYDHIVEFSGDQHGSRFIQHKLETANSDEKERVFREIQQNELQLMQDVFGNYVIQKFFEHGDQNQKRHLANRMKGRVVDLTKQMYGCRVVQKALEHILADQQAAIIKELDGHVLPCVQDQNGNHVIQKAIERVPAEHVRFIVDAFKGQTKKLAVHPYGCRVIQRMLEHCESSAKKQILVELHGCDASMFTDQYGNYVTQHMVEYGDVDDRSKVIDKVKNALLLLCRHKFASNVVEKCIALGTDEQRKVLMLKLCEKVDPNNPNSDTNLLLTIKDGYGNYVVQRLLDTLNATDFNYFLERLQPEVQKVKKLIPGKHVVAVEKKMHRFDKPEQPLSQQSQAGATVTDVTVPPRTPITSASESQQASPGTSPSLASPRSGSLPSTTVSSQSSTDEPHAPSKESIPTQPSSQ